jgi:hypothetical protein
MFRARPDRPSIPNPRPRAATNSSSSPWARSLLYSHTIDLLVAETARHLDLAADAILSNDPKADAIVFKTQLVNSKGQFMIGRLALRAAELNLRDGGGSATSRSRNFDRHWL